MGLAECFDLAGNHQGSINFMQYLDGSIEVWSNLFRYVITTPIVDGMFQLFADTVCVIHPTIT